MAEANVSAPSDAETRAAAISSASSVALYLCMYGAPVPCADLNAAYWDIMPTVDYTTADRPYEDWKKNLYTALAEINASGAGSKPKLVTGRAPLTFMLQLGAALGVGTDVSFQPGNIALPCFGSVRAPRTYASPPMVSYTYIPTAPLDPSMSGAEKGEAHLLFLGTVSRGGDFSRFGYRTISVPENVQSVSAVCLDDDHVLTAETAEALCYQLETGINNAFAAIIANHGKGLEKLNLYVVSSLAGPLSMAAGLYLRKSVRPTCFPKVGLLDRVGVDYVSAGELDYGIWRASSTTDA